jgi:uncharacterized protein DUF3631
MPHPLVDATTVRRFLTLLHTRAAAALHGAANPGVLQLCRISPHDDSIVVSRFRVGDVDHMADAALIDAEAGFNVYVEGRTVRGDTDGRGSKAATVGVFAFGIERDADTGKAGRPLSDKATLTVETSPGNCHEWLFLDRALTGPEAVPIGDAIRRVTGADSGTGVITQLLRVAGTPNFPNAKKRARGRVECATRVSLITSKLWTHADLIAAFPPAPPPVSPTPRAPGGKRKTHTKVALKVAAEATPDMDRSAQFQSAVSAAIHSGMTPDELEAQMRAHPQGCAGKYMNGSTDRLRAELERSWAKAEQAAKPAAPEVTPDPDADGAALLEDVHAFLGRFVAYPSEETHIAHTLWVAHAHLMDRWETTPRIAFLSPEPESGKTRALEIGGLLVPTPLMAINVSPAYLFRKVAADRPTILFDEVDTVFTNRTSNGGATEEVRGLLNAGHRKGAVAGRCVARGQTVETEELPAYCAVALAGIGDLPDTILSRSIIVPMRRRSPSEHVEPYRPRIHDTEGHALRDRLAAWAAGAVPRITWPVLPAAVQDRQADVWEPLIAVADAAGGRWPDTVRITAVTLATCSRGAALDASLGVRLLADLHTVFEGSETKLTTTLLEALYACPEAPWLDIRGKPLTDRGLAMRLRPYGIKPGLLRINNVVGRGYTRADFRDAWGRYLPPEGAPP